MTKVDAMIKKKMINSEENGMRLDRWMKKHYPQLSYSLLQKLIRKGQIRINGGRCKTHLLISEGDEVRLPPLDQEMKTQDSLKVLSARETQALKSMIIFENDAFFVVNKPSGLAVQGGTHQKHSLDLLFKSLTGYHEARLTHRLDKDTSGLLIFAKSMHDAAWLTAAFKSRSIMKVYHALTLNPPSDSAGRLEGALIKRHQKMHLSKSLSTEAKDAATEYRLLKQHPTGISWVELRPLTGRMHQLRVHCAAHGFPILGDEKYGPVPSVQKEKLYLHAHALSFDDPLGNPFHFEAPWPPHFEARLNELGFLTAHS